MSVVYQTILLYGWRIPFDTIDTETTFEYDPKEVEPKNPVIVSDGRGGDYEFIGELISKTNTTRNGHQSFSQPQKIDPKDYVVSEKTEEVIESEGLHFEKEPSVYVLTHIT
jgi:hypothetical protein